MLRVARGGRVVAARCPARVRCLSSGFNQASLESQRPLGSTCDSAKVAVWPEASGTLCVNNRLPHGPAWTVITRGMASQADSEGAKPGRVVDAEEEDAPQSHWSQPTDVEPHGRPSWLPKWLYKDHIVAGEGFNRWWVPPASIATHLCIGSVYAWSIFNTPLTRELGVVTAAANDWSLGSVVPIFSTAIVCLGLSAAVAGKWLEQVGPRLVGVTSALLWGGGIMVGGMGVAMHSLPLLYLGYGVLGGCGLGLGYVSPVSTLIRWFPDRRGMATGMAIMGFGGGAMIAAPLKQALLRRFYESPTYLGTVDTVHLVTENGRRMAEVAGEWKEVVVATATEVAAMPIPGLEGVYVVGTGNTGAAQAFFTLGAGYLAVIMAGAFAYRVPHEGWTPAGWTPPVVEDTASKAEPGESASSMITTRNVHIDTALHTPQFWLLWTTLCCNVTAGIGVIGVAKTMVDDIFCTTMPLAASAPFAALYVQMISVFNMAGRFGWASASDKLGRKNTYHTFFGLGIPLYLSIPWIAGWASSSSSDLPLYAFCGSTMVIFTMYGGGFATIPAYLADIFGTKYVGGIHGRLLTAWSTAGLLGPLAITNLRQHSFETAMHDLAAKVDSQAFQDAFGAPVSQLQSLIEAKSVTIPRLMEISPPDTVDPTPFMYNTTMYAMASFLGVAAVANSLVRPVNSKYWLKDDEEEK